MDPINFPLPGKLNEQWNEADIRRFLQARRAEDKHFECKAFLHFDWDLKCFGERSGDKGLEQRPYHCKKPTGSILAFKVIETIMAFANTEGGLLLLGVAESGSSQRPFDLSGIPITSSPGDLNFIIAGIERDGVGVTKHGLNEDLYKRQLMDVLFPEKKGWLTYTEKTTKTKDDGSPGIVDSRFQVYYPSEYNKSIVKSIKLIPFKTTNGKTATVAAIVVAPSDRLIAVTELRDGKYQILKIYRRLAFNNNTPLTGDAAAAFIRSRAARETNAGILQALNDLKEQFERIKEHQPAMAPHAAAPARTAEDRVPWLFREALADYVVPSTDAAPLPDIIRKATLQGKNVFILGDSGMGKSLLLSHCYLSFDSQQPSCFYSIDRTQGPNVYRTAAVLGAIREQIQQLDGMPAIDPPPRRESKALWVWELEYLQTALRTWADLKSESNLLVFIDGLDENDEALESELILNALKDLIRDKRYRVTWVLSSQPRPGMEWVASRFDVVTLTGLYLSQAVKLLKKHLSIETDDKVLGDLVGRSLIEGGLYDPEMIVMLGKAICEKLSDAVPSAVSISTGTITPLLDDLPLNPREKYTWLFERYTNENKLNDIPSLAANAKRWNQIVPHVSYTQFLCEILAVTSLVRIPIPLDILQWALELEDPNPEEDFRGRKQPAYNAYPPDVFNRGILDTALLDLKRFIKTIENREGGFAFCKEAVRRSFIGFASAGLLKTAESRLTGLANTEIRLTNVDNIRP